MAIFVVFGGLIFVFMNGYFKKDVYYEMENIAIPTDDTSSMNNIYIINGENTIDFRTKQDKISAIEKFRNGNGKIIMFHYSSCCKSTLTEWFYRISAKLRRLHSGWNSSIENIEITNTFHLKFGMNIGEYMISNRDIIFIICFNEPIKRILAQYDKEWRWMDCNQQCVMQQYNKIYLKMDNYLLTRNKTKEDIEKEKEEERFAVIDFNDFLYRIVKFEIEQESINKHLYQMYLNNYYIWSFCCKKEQCSMARDIELNNDLIIKCIKYTMNVINSFDLIFIKDWIQDLRVQHYVNELFFEDNNIDDQQNKFVAVAKKKYSISRMGNNYMFNPENEDILNFLNKHDLKLFEWTKDLVFNRTHVIWERAKENKNNRNELVYDLGFKHIINHQ